MAHRIAPGSKHAGPDADLQDALAVYSTPPFPAALRVKLHRLHASTREAVRNIPDPHSAKSAAAYEGAIVDIAGRLLRIAKLSPAPSTDVKESLFRISCSLLKGANFCRYPKMERRLDGPAEGYYASLGLLAKALAFAQGDVPSLAEDPKERVVRLFDELRELSRAEHVDRSPRPGEWRLMFDSVLQDAADLALKESTWELPNMRLVYDTEAKNLEKKVDANAGSLNEEVQLELVQALIWVKAVAKILEVFSEKPLRTRARV